MTNAIEMTFLFDWTTLTYMRN